MGAACNNAIPAIAAVKRKARMGEIVSHHVIPVALLRSGRVFRSPYSQMRRGIDGTTRAHGCPNQLEVYMGSVTRIAVGLLFTGALISLSAQILNLQDGTPVRLRLMKT